MYLGRRTEDVGADRMGHEVESNAPSTVSAESLLDAILVLDLHPRIATTRVPTRYSKSTSDECRYSTPYSVPALFPFGICGHWSPVLVHFAVVGVVT